MGAPAGHEYQTVRPTIQRPGTPFPADNLRAIGDRWLLPSSSDHHPGVRQTVMQPRAGVLRRRTIATSEEKLVPGLVMAGICAPAACRLPVRGRLGARFARFHADRGLPASVEGRGATTTATNPPPAARGQYRRVGATATTATSTTTRVTSSPPTSGLARTAAGFPRRWKFMGRWAGCTTSSPTTRRARRSTATPSGRSASTCVSTTCG